MLRFTTPPIADLLNEGQPSAVARRSVGQPASAFQGAINIITIIGLAVRSPHSFQAAPSAATRQPIVTSGRDPQAGLGEAWRREACLAK
ncbi:MAG: hypothetical protein WC729_09325 [Sphingomonas sp.]|jgi:hypothetical protein|uniref:hypothetical protein n=1 Tax=Sphingomonas sp. TaxID=28214 RepID=UPI00356590F6